MFRPLNTTGSSSYVNRPSASAVTTRYPSIFTSAPGTRSFTPRGAAEGTVRYNDGSVVAQVTVTVGRRLFSQLRTAKSDAQGFYRIEACRSDRSRSAQDEAGNVTFAENDIATPGQLVTQNLSIFRQPFPGLGKVHGVVRRSDTNAAMAGVHVGVYSQGYD